MIVTTAQSQKLLHEDSSKHQEKLNSIFNKTITSSEKAIKDRFRIVIYYLISEPILRTGMVYLIKFEAIYKCSFLFFQYSLKVNLKTDIDFQYSNKNLQVYFAYSGYELVKDVIKIQRDFVENNKASFKKIRDDFKKDTKGMFKLTFSISLKTKLIKIESTKSIPGFTPFSIYSLLSPQPNLALFKRSVSTSEPV